MYSAEGGARHEVMIAASVAIHSTALRFKNLKNFIEISFRKCHILSDLPIIQLFYGICNTYFDVFHY